MSKSVVICLPQYGSVPSRFVEGLSNLLLHKSESYEITKVIVNNALYVDHNRNILVKEALDSGAEYSMWIDADVVVEPNTIDRLIRHNKAIMSGIYPRKNTDTACAYVYNETYEYLRPIGPWKSNKPFKVEAVGMGCVLIRTDVFKEIGPPWYIYNAYVNYSEDLYFFDVARAADIEVWVDPTVLPEHIGTRGIRIQPPKPKPKTRKGGRRHGRNTR